MKIVLTGLALLVCFSRVVLGAHYFSDVLAGLGLAFLALPVAVLWCNFILGKMTHLILAKATRRWVLVYVGLIVLLVVI